MQSHTDGFRGWLVLPAVIHDIMGLKRHTKPSLLSTRRCCYPKTAFLNSCQCFCQLLQSHASEFRGPPRYLDNLGEAGWCCQLSHKDTTQGNQEMHKAQSFQSTRWCYCCPRLAYHCQLSEAAGCKGDIVDCDVEQPSRTAKSGPYPFKGDWIGSIATVSMLR